MGCSLPSNCSQAGFLCCTLGWSIKWVAIPERRFAWQFRGQHYLPRSIPTSYHTIWRDLKSEWPSFESLHWFENCGICFITRSLTMVHAVSITRWFPTLLCRCALHHLRVLCLCLGKPGEMCNLHLCVLQTVGPGFRDSWSCSKHLPFVLQAPYPREIRPYSAMLRSPLLVMSAQGTISSNIPL